MKLAIISGGSKGLGAALCESYHRSGYQVVEFSRSAPHSFSTRADFSDPEGAVRVVAKILSGLAAERYDEIVIVNNAGTVQPVGPTAKKEVSQILHNLNVNLVSGILFISATIRQFQDLGCRKTIAHITSGAALKGYSGWSLYCGAKAGMENFVRSVALEQEAETHPFHLISIDPGVMDTEMQAGIRVASDSDFPDVARFVELKRSGSLRSPELVADAVVKIVSKNSGSGLRYSVSDFLD